MPVSRRVLRNLNFGFPFECHGILLCGNLDILWLRSGNWHLESEPILSLEQVCTNYTPAHRMGGNKAVSEETIHSLTQRNSLVEGIVTCQICHRSMSFQNRCLFCTSLVRFSRTSMFVFVFWL